MVSANSDGTSDRRCCLHCAFPGFQSIRWLVLRPVHYRLAQGVEHMRSSHFATIWLLALRLAQVIGLCASGILKVEQVNMRRTSSTDKAQVLERIVAMLHEGPGVTVQQRVKLPTLFNPRRKREIDVLITGLVAGHRVQLAIECRNVQRPIGTEEIGDFARKLEQVGLAPSQGIFVARSRFTQDALDHARSLNMKTLVFPNLTEDGLNLTVSEALQSVVFLLAEVVELNLVNDLAEPIAQIADAFMLYDQNDEPAGTIPDFVWDAWRMGNIEPVIGKHLLELKFPDQWYNLTGGKKQSIRAVGVTVQVIGLALTLRGESRSQSLAHAPDGTVDRLSTEATWQPLKGQYELRTFETPPELEEYVTSEPLLHVVTQIPLPRIQFWNMMFWPPSERVAGIIKDRMEAFQRGLGPDPRPFDFTELEGTDLSVVWEPIAREYFPDSQDAA